MTHVFEHAFEAPVVTRAEDNTPITAPGAPSGDALDAINERCALTPQEGDRIFTWWLEGSNNSVDSHATWMDHDTTLRNYMADVGDGAGIPYMRNHATGGMLSDPHDPQGRLFAGLLVEGPAPETRRDGVQLARDAFGRTPAKTVRALMQAYMRRGITINGQANDDLIANLEAGVQRSNSVGFSVYSPMAPGSRLECDICGVDLFDRDADGDFSCSHMPGVDYHVERAGAGGGDTEAERVHVLATAKIVGAHLREVSGVYLGSTPGTYTLASRGNELYTAGKLSERSARQWEETHRLQRGAVTGGGVAIFDMGKGTGRTPAAPSSTGGNSDVTKEQQTDLVSRIRGTLGDDVDRVAAFELAMDGGNADPVAALLRVTTDEINKATKAAREAEQAKTATVKALRERLAAGEDEPLLDAVDRLAKLATLGQGFKDRLIDEALRQMTRAGLDYDADAQRSILARLEPAEIEGQSTMFKAQADGQLSPGRVAPNSAKPKGDRATKTRRPNVALSL